MHARKILVTLQRPWIYLLIQPFSSSNTKNIESFIKSKNSRLPKFQCCSFGVIRTGFKTRSTSNKYRDFCFKVRPNIFRMNFTEKITRLISISEAYGEFESLTLDVIWVSGSSSFVFYTFYSGRSDIFLKVQIAVNNRNNPVS